MPVQLFQRAHSLRGGGSAPDMAMVDVDNEDNDLVASSEEEVESADEGLASAPTMPRSKRSVPSSAGGVAAGPKAVSKRTPSPSASIPLVGLPKKESKREKEPTKKMTDDAKLMKLVSRQNFDGSFQLDDGLAKLLNTSLEDIKEGKIEIRKKIIVQ